MPRPREAADGATRRAHEVQARLRYRADDWTDDGARFVVDARQDGLQPVYTHDVNTHMYDVAGVVAITQ